MAVNLSSATTLLSETIANEFIQTCTSNASNTQSFECTNSDDVTIKSITFESYQTSVNNCMQNNTNINNAKANVSSIIDQTATAKEENVFNSFIIIFFVIIGIIFIIFIGLGGTNWWLILVLIVIVIIIIGYASLSSSIGLWPFQKLNK